MHRKSYMSWSDCVYMMRMMNKVNEQIVLALSNGKTDQGILCNDFPLAISVHDLKHCLDKVIEKDKNNASN